MKRLALMIAGFVTLIAAAACNTVQGAGEDIERAGEEIEDAADG